MSWGIAPDDMDGVKPKSLLEPQEVSECFWNS